MLHQHPVVSDALATAVSSGIALSVLWLLEQTAKLGLFDQVRIGLHPPYFPSLMIFLPTMLSQDAQIFPFTPETKFYSHLE